MASSSSPSFHQPPRIDEETLARLVRDGPAQARYQALQAACMAIVCFFVVLFSSLALQ